MRTLLPAASAALALTVPLAAQDAAKPAAPAPSEIVAAAPRADWTPIPAEDLLVMTLAPNAEGKPRQVVIQLIPAPFSQGWVHNIRLLARAKWYDGISVNRVQDNYVAQWGDPNYDNPEATGKPKPLPQGLKVMTQADYTITAQQLVHAWSASSGAKQPAAWSADPKDDPARLPGRRLRRSLQQDAYSYQSLFLSGWPLAKEGTFPEAMVWPIHCYGMVGVGRNYSPDTGSGAELYTVIGHAPRHLDRNIALVGRVVEGMQFLSSLPRGSGDLGFYTAAEADKRTPILTVRVASDLPPAEQPKFEYLSTESGTFAAYAEAIANRRDPFFIVPAGGADVCNIKVPVRRVTTGK